MVGCLILSHGQIAQAFVDACKKISGDADNLYTLKCDGLAPKALLEKIENLIETEDLKDGLFILVSLRGGSYWNAAARLAQKYDKIEIISGLNLSQVLSFITKKNKYSFEKLAEVLYQDGLRGITRFKLRQG